MMKLKIIESLQKRQEKLKRKKKGRIRVKFKISKNKKFRLKDAIEKKTYKKVKDKN